MSVSQTEIFHIPKGSVVFVLRQPVLGGWVNTQIHKNTTSYDHNFLRSEVVFGPGTTPSPMWDHVKSGFYKAGYFAFEKKGVVLLVHSDIVNNI